LSERIAAAVPEASAQIWVGTFHAFGLDLIRRHHDRLGGASLFLYDQAIDMPHNFCGPHRNVAM